MSPSLHFSVPAAFDIHIQGKNLNKVSKVTLHGQAAVLKPTGATALQVSFTEAGTKSIPSTEGAKLEFFTSDGKSESVVETLLVRIARAPGG